MNRRHRRTLEAIFAHPASGAIRWRDSERAGSRVAILLNDRVAVFHRPHPGPEMSWGAVRDLRRFLRITGVTP